MTLRDLEPEFMVRLEDRTSQLTEDLPGADGVRFLCPKCFITNGGKVGTHGVICWQPHVPADVMPGPGRWSFSGTGLDDLTLIAGSSSIALPGGDGGCGAHFYVRVGAIELLPS